MAKVEITSRESFAAWLKTRPAADDDILAARIGLRVLPLWGRANKTERDILEARIRDKLSLLPIFRILLIKSIASGHADAYGRANAKVANVVLDAGANNSAIGATKRLGLLDSSGQAEQSLWLSISVDLTALQNGKSVIDLPLWPMTQPRWFIDADAEVRGTWAKDPDTWAFWVRWWDGVIAGKPLPLDLQRDVARIPDEIWQQGPTALAVGIAKIERDRANTFNAIKPLSRTYFFDFVEHDRKLRLSGVPLDFEGRSEEEITKCLSKVREFKDDLLDWVDATKDALFGTNEVSSLQKTAQKIVDLIETQGGDKNFPAARLITLGASLRLFSLDEIQRAKVGATLAQIMDQRIDQLSALIGNCFGHVLARLEPLNDLELGSHDPTAMIAQLREFVERLKSVDPAEVLPMDAEAKAQVMELLRELDEMDAAISAGADPKQVAVLQSRFANRYGALGATLARSIEKGRAFSGTVASKFDEGVKWYQRWVKISDIIDWFNNLPPPS